jgi:hypothetical protein
MLNRIFDESATLPGEHRAKVLAALASSVHALPEDRRGEVLNRIFDESAMLSDKNRAKVLAALAYSVHTLPEDRQGEMLNRVLDESATLSDENRCEVLAAAASCLDDLPENRRAETLNRILGESATLAPARQAIIQKGLADAAAHFATRAAQYHVALSMPIQESSSTFNSIYQRILNGNDAVMDAASDRLKADTLAALASGIPFLPETEQRQTIDTIFAASAALPAAHQATVLLGFAKSLDMLSQLHSPDFGPLLEKILTEKSIVEAASEETKTAILDHMLWFLGHAPEHRQMDALNDIDELSATLAPKYQQHVPHFYTNAVESLRMNNSPYVFACIDKMLLALDRLPCKFGNDALIKLAGQIGKLPRNSESVAQPMDEFPPQGCPGSITNRHDTFAAVLERLERKDSHNNLEMGSGDRVTLIVVLISQIKEFDPASESDSADAYELFCDLHTHIQNLDIRDWDIGLSCLAGSIKYLPVGRRFNCFEQIMSEVNKFPEGTARARLFDVLAQQVPSLQGLPLGASEQDRARQMLGG